MKKLLEKFNLKKLSDEIGQYGYKYSTKDFFIQTSAMVAIVFLVAMFAKLHPSGIIGLVIIALFASPLIIVAWFKQLYNTTRFTFVSDYLTNIVPIFMQTPKIRTALVEVSDLVSDKMRDVVLDAIEYMDNPPQDSVDIDKEALAIIEQEFPNNRVKSVHKMMMTIERESSKDYIDTCENVFQDVEAWIRRVYLYQVDLKSRRNKLIVLCGLSLVVTFVFAMMYSSNEYFDGYTDTTAYQIITFLYITALFGVMVFVLTKLHGAWLVNDSTKKNEEQLIKDFELTHNPYKMYKPVNVMFAIIFSAGGVYTFFIREYVVGAAFILLAFSFLNLSKNKYKAARNRLRRSLEIEFPVWLSDVSLNLNTSTVVNAIRKSYENASYPMRMEIDELLEAIKENPNSIRPYNNFLAEYDLQDARSTMKVLFSLNNMDKAHVKERVSGLIIRNQEMLAKSEQLMNQDALTTVEMTGYLPLILLMLNSMASMFLLFSFVFGKLQAIIASALTGM